MGNITLPPLPPSDMSALQRNHYDGFYRVGARDFWKEAQVDSHKVEDFKKCLPHYFVQKGHEAQCTKCHVGWVIPTNMRVEEGKLYQEEQEIVFQI